MIPLVYVVPPVLRGCKGLVAPRVQPASVGPKVSKGLRAHADPLETRATVALRVMKVPLGHEVPKGLKGPKVPEGPQAMKAQQAPAVQRVSMAPRVPMAVMEPPAGIPMAMAWVM